MFSQNQEAAQEVLSEDEQKELDSSIIPYGGHATIHQGNISFSGNLTVTVPTPAQTPVPVNINVGHTNTHNTILTRRAVEAQEQYRLKQEQDAAEKKAKEFTAKLLHLKTSLPAHYQRYHQLERLFDEGKTSIVDSFINLALIKETEHKQKEKRLDRGANLVEEKDENVKEFIDERMASHEELYAVKEPLALNQLFEPKDDTKTPNKILILGRAGIGKSVLCQYLAVQWAAGLECKDEEQRQSEIGHYFRQKFDAVFWVKLREMADFLSHPDIDKPTARKNLLGYVIHKFCFRLDKKLSPEEIETYIESNKGKALFILDGYDEITEQVRQSHYLDNFLDRMKHQPYLLMTSRPVAIEALKINFDRKLENIGFTNENIEAYVRHFMNDVEKSDQAEPLLKFLKTHPSIWGIAHVPINLELLSWLWSQGDLVLAQGKAMTLSKLYQTIVDRVQGECAKKFNPLQASQREESKEEEPSSTDIVNEFLEYLAYAAMQQESLLIPKNQLKDALIKTFRKHRKPNNQREQERVLKSATDQFGFLRATGQGGRSLLDQPHYFIHLSFQEFYAARYITRVLSERGPGESEEKAHVIQHIIAEKYMPRYQLMLWMTAGLLYQQGVEQGRNFSALEQFWKAILSEPRDLIGFHQMVLVMHCLDECEADDHLPVHNMLINQQRQWVNFYIRHYYYGKYKYTDELARCPLLHSSKLMIDHMLKNLKDEDKNVRCAAVSALGKLQDPRGEVANALLTALKDENEDVRGA
ncbi:MAG: repeat protein, partial [Gammaproteobacteria bacterium]|nr:repeat protein [Gammaproteobacteria bacterium]